MIISITGDLGSGKSAVAKELCKKINFRYISTGSLHREIAEEYAVDSLKLNQIAKTDFSIDDRIDNYLKSLDESEENIIIDSRLAWYFVRSSIRFYFEVNPKVAAERVFNDNTRKNEPLYTDITSALNALQERKKIENDRFKMRYGVECDDLSNFDSIINTSLSSIDEICETMIKIINQIRNKNKYPNHLINPRLLFPTENIRFVESKEAKDICLSIKNNGFDYDYPIECVEYGYDYFIWNGHKRCSGAILNNINFVPIVVLAKNKEEIYKRPASELFAKNAMSLSSYHDWEDFHKFNFITYPCKNIE